jgi:hypothetical protein
MEIKAPPIERSSYLLWVESQLWSEFMAKCQKNNDKAQRILQIAVKEYLNDTQRNDS